MAGEQRGVNRVQVGGAGQADVDPLQPPSGRQQQQRGIAAPVGDERQLGADQVGALGELPLALSSRVYLFLFAGELTAAASLTEEVRAATEATGSSLAPYGALGVAVLRGQEAEASALIRATGQDVALRGEGVGVTLTEWANAVLYNSLGRYDRALTAAEHGSQDPNELGLAAWSMVELIEAAARTGQPGRAAGPLRFITEITSAAGPIGRSGSKRARGRC